MEGEIQEEYSMELDTSEILEDELFQQIGDDTKRNEERDDAGIIWLGVTFIQLLTAGHSILAKIALTRGMYAEIYACYRNLISSASLWVIFFTKMKAFPRMTYGVGWKIVVLAILEPVIDQNIFYVGLLRTNGGFSACMSAMTPVLTFVIALALRIEQLRLHQRSGQMKLFGALVVIVGAILMAVQLGPISVHSALSGSNNKLAGHTANWTEGAPLTVLAVLCGAAYNLLMGHTLATYPHPVILVACTSSVGALTDFAVALVIGRGLGKRWRIQWDLILATYLYGGVLVSTLGFWILGVLIKRRGSVFIASFSPLSMVLVLLPSVFALKATTYLTSIAGLVVISVGLATFLWGMSRETENKEAGVHAAEDEHIERPKLDTEVEMENDLEDQDEPKAEEKDFDDTDLEKLEADPITKVDTDTDDPEAPI